MLEGHYFLQKCSSLTSIRERDIHLGLWRRLREVTEEKFSFNDIEFVDVKFEPRVNGQPDLVVYASEKAKKIIPILVIETKRKVPTLDPRFDAFSDRVINQAERYASRMGAPYFATCDGKILVLFKTFVEGVPLPKRRLTYYPVTFPIDQNFAKMLLEEVAKFRIGKGKWLPLDDIFVERLRSFHRFITPFIYQSLRKKLKEDAHFKNEYVRWLKSQLFEYSDKMNKSIAEQMAYLLMNKIAFYKTLETQIPELIQLKKIDTDEGSKFSEELQKRFSEVVSKADYEGIFQPTILDKVPLPNKLVYNLNEFIEELGAYNLGKIRSDVLGRVYEDLIPPDDRHRLGQYYTPPPIVELIVEMCVKSPNDKVLDPACGSGSFLVKAYHKLRDLKKKENPFRTNDELHKELLEQVYGIDINPFPAQLSSINLAVRNLKVQSEHINLLPSDFFKVKPSMPPLPREFDVVVTNPPYTRQEEMEYKDKVRSEALTYSDGSKIDIGRRAGIYAYFFTHSAKFLKDRGKMGYITSNTWLDVKFGEGLKKFFLDRFKIQIIIEHDAGVFEIPIVDTCITILQKAEKNVITDQREENLVRFVRIKKPLDIEEVVKKVEATTSSYEDDMLRIVPVKQSSLKPTEKWGNYLRAPKVYFKIMNKPNMTKLNDVCDVKWGLKTGANKFFVLKKKDANSWGIEKEYLKKIVRSPRTLGRIELRPDDVDSYVLFINKPKVELKEKNVLKYVEYGEKIGYAKGRTVSGRQLWYSVGEREPAPIIFPYIIRKRVFFVWNKPRYLAINVFHEISPKKEKDTIVLLGLLNSSLTAFLVELHGRLYGGGLLKLETYEVQNLPILDPNKLSTSARTKIEQAFYGLCEAEYKGDKKGKTEAKEKLDNTIFEILNLTDVKQKIYDGLKSMREMRLQRRAVEVLIKTGEKWMPPKKSRTKIAKDETIRRLDAWIQQSE